MRSKVPVCILAGLMMILNGCNSRDDFPVLRGPYLGQTPPGMTPQVFAPDVFSDFKYTFCSVFSPDGKEYYFAGTKSDDDKAGIFCM